MAPGTHGKRTTTSQPHALMRWIGSIRQGPTHCPDYDCLSVCLSLSRFQTTMRWIDRARGLPPLAIPLNHLPDGLPATLNGVGGASSALRPPHSPWKLAIRRRIFHAGLLVAVARRNASFAHCNPSQSSHDSLFCVLRNSRAPNGFFGCLGSRFSV
jgi:hypothetical protein